MSKSVQNKPDALPIDKRNGSSNPWIKANIFSRLFFWWLNPIIQLGNRRALQIKDLYDVLPEDKSSELGIVLGREWLKQVAKCENSKNKTRPSFKRALFGQFGPRCLLLGLQVFIGECVVKIGQPLFLSQLINYFNQDSDISVEYAYLYATCLVFCSVYNFLNIHAMAFAFLHIGMQARVATCSLIFRKSLTLSQSALCKTYIGQIINLISNDVSRFDQVFDYLHYLWIGPLQVIITTLILYFNIGISSIVGMFVLLSIVPIQLQIGKAFSRFRKETAERTDDRIRMINEIISSMGVLKMYAWEKPFLKFVQSFRSLEMKVIRRTSYLRAFNVTLFCMSAKLVIFPTLVTFVLLGNELTPNKVFLTVALFNNIRTSMPGYFSTGIQFVAETIVSLNRIQEFLLLEEKPTSTDGNSFQDGNSFIEAQVASKVFSVNLKEVSVKWPVASNEHQENVLNDISLQIHSGHMLTVVGQIGCGKSTLLNVILGELNVLNGSCVVEGRVAYCSQEPWLITGTIRQNILCGKEMDVERYHQVIRATALEKDLEQFPHGDCSIIGEGAAVSLSGGQKARVNLARCLYVEADIYLLDDPLSSIDTEVGDQIFQRAIKMFLREKIVVLVTHQLHYLQETDLILLLKQGRGHFCGTFKDFKNFHQTHPKVVENPGSNSDEEHGNIESKSFIANKTLQPVQRKESILSRRNITSVKSPASHSSRIISSKVRAKPSSVIVAEDTLQQEEADSGRVNAATYWQYFSSGGSVFYLILLVLNCLVAEILLCASDYWLNLWISAERVKWTTDLTISNDTRIEESRKTYFEVIDNWLDRQMGVNIYSILIGGVLIFGYLRAAQFHSVCNAASEKLHDIMFRAVLRAPVQFFDSNPVGRIVNRFSKDTGCMDDTLPSVMFDPIWVGLNTLGAIITVAVVKYWLIVPALLLGIIFYSIRRIYLQTSSRIKQLESTTKSPVFTQLYSSLTGLTTLRAHRCQNYFQKDFDRFQDIHSSAWFLFIASARWLGVWMDMIVVLYVASVTYACVALRGSMSNSEAGLIISAALGMVRFNYGIRQSAEMVNQMTSVHRIIEYGRIPPEAPLESSENHKPPPHWPSSGAIDLEDMSLSYSHSNPPVLKNLTCNINAREKVGIVGRSGAGKSSIIAALFRLTEPDGKILIDDVDIRNIGLHDLRSKISIIPQEPMLFSGSLRINLDPFEQISDQVLWSAIKDVHLDVFMAAECGSRDILDFTITEGGANLSVGQRQLICLARAILRDNRILILDEATASIDKETDNLMQLLIREKFINCTVLTIAHRLNTIIDSDKIMVLDFGQLSEFDTPLHLLSKPTGIFRSLVKKLGPEEAKEFLNLSKQLQEKSE